MIPSNFRPKSGSKSSKPSSPRQSSPILPKGVQTGTSNHTLPGSMLFSASGSSAGTAGYQASHRKAPSPLINSGNSGNTGNTGNSGSTGNTQGPLRNAQQMSPQTQNLPRQRGGPQSGSKAAVGSPDPRRIIADHIIRDCYSKAVIVDGRKVPEVKYNTHLSIREYAMYPQSAPPTDLSPAQIGSVKSRILVVCTKHSGRVLLQKGKYNDEKKVYQIGRTWDLEELMCITGISSDALILHLNKDYFWKSGDEPGRLYKFIHHLSVIYHRYRGFYPELKGINLESLGLVSSLPPTIAPSSPALSPKSNKTTSTYSPKASVKHYKDMDFTVNGTLPVKPMQVMDVDRPSLKSNLGSRQGSQQGSQHDSQGSQQGSTRHSVESFSVKSPQGSTSILSKDSLRESPKHVVDTPKSTSTETKSINDSQPGVFIGPDTADEGTKTMPTISEKSQNNLLPSMNFKSVREQREQRDVSENLETAARYSLQLERKLDGYDSDKDKSALETPETSTFPSIQVEKDGDSIEEASFSESSSDLPSESQKFRAIRNATPENQERVRAGSRNDSVIDDSIKEIEDFMATQFGKTTEESETVNSQSQSPSKALARKLSESSRSQSFATDDRGDDTSSEPQSNQSTHKPASAAVSQAGPSTENDPEIEDLLDEMGWNPTDSSEACIKMLRKELISVKHKNVMELTYLDFGKDSFANEVKTATGEIENVVEIFKRMEASFMMIAPQINNIEENSQGLQVEAVNKKILYNELDELLRKVRLNDRDLSAVANYDNFYDTSKVPHLEQKLLLLFDALQAMGCKTSTDDLSKMQALRQYHETYEQVSNSFIQKYLDFFTNNIRKCIEKLNKDVSTIFPQNVMPCFRESLAYTGINAFVKSTSERSFTLMIDKFNACLADLMDNVLTNRVKSLQSGINNAKHPRLSYGSESGSGLKKSKSSRFGSTRFLGRLPGVSSDHNSTPKQPEIAPQSSGEVNDSRLIIRLVKESTDFMLVIQFIMGSVFNLTSEEDFSTYVSSNNFEDRVKRYDASGLDEINYKSNSNDVLRNMSIIFGNYINKLTREVTPTDLITIEVLLGLSGILAEAEEKKQDFVAYSFVSKLSEKYRANWDRFIAHQIDVIDKSEIRAKGGIVPAVRNMNHIISTIETSLQDSHYAQHNYPEISSLIKTSYESLTISALKLFNRDDPLLKSNAHDEKEKAYRNVAILQNLFSILQQLSEYDSTIAADMKEALGSAFKKVQEEYFDYIMRMHLGRVSEFVNAHPNNEQVTAVRNKKEEKILVRGIASSLTSRDMSSKISDMFRRMQRHVVASDTMFEHDLFELMWKHLQEVVENVLRQFYRIAKTIDRDVEESISASEIRRQFIEHYRHAHR